MKKLLRTIQAAQDFRQFYGFTIDELIEDESPYYYDLFRDIEDDVEFAYLSANPKCNWIGVLDTTGRYYVTSISDVEYDEWQPYWKEVSFEQLCNYFK